MKAAAEPVLLVDDFPDTGRTPAVISRLLLRAGATAMFLLVPAVQG